MDKYKQNLLELFAFLDSDGSGTVELFEMFVYGKNLNPSWTLQKCKELFAKFDADHDGHITQDEFLSFFASLHDSMPEKKFQKNLQDLVDVMNASKKKLTESTLFNTAGGHGKYKKDVSLRESVKKEAAELPEHRRKQVLSVFLKLDKDNSGYLDMFELFVFGRLLQGSSFGMKDCANLFREMDDNSDTKIEVDEFLAYVYRTTKKMSDAEFNERFQDYIEALS